MATLVIQLKNCHRNLESTFESDLPSALRNFWQEGINYKCLKTLFRKEPDVERMN
jgi:hypothetical protein